MSKHCANVGIRENPSASLSWFPIDSYPIQNTSMLFYENCPTGVSVGGTGGMGLDATPGVCMGTVTLWSWMPGGAA